MSNTNSANRFFTPWSAGSTKNQEAAFEDPFNIFGANNPAPYQVDFSTMPQYPGYNPVYDPKTQSLGPNFQGQLASIQPDQSGLNAYAQSALRTGPSPWANLATAKSYQDQALQGDTLAKNNASDVATAQGNLAMRGGARSGARERVGTSGNTNLLNAQQANAGTGMQNRTQIGVNDEQNRIAQLGQLPGMQLQQAQFGLQKAGMGEAAQATDIQNQMLGAQAANQYNLAAYTNQSQMWGAGQQANATAASGSQSKSWLCSEAAKRTGQAYTRDEMRALTLLKRYANAEKADEAKFYFSECHELARLMAQATPDWSEVQSFVKRVIFQITVGDIEGAYNRYRNFVREKLDQYWLGCVHPTYVGV